MSCEEDKNESRLLSELSRELEKTKLMLQFEQDLNASREDTDDRREYWRSVFTWSVVVPFVIGAIIFHAVAAHQLALRFLQ
jgi:hypothetical protein